MPKPTPPLLEKYPLFSREMLLPTDPVTSPWWPAHTCGATTPEGSSLRLNRVLLAECQLTFLDCSGGIELRPLEPSPHATCVVPLRGSIEIETPTAILHPRPTQLLLLTAGWIRRLDATAAAWLMVSFPTHTLPSELDRDARLSPQQQRSLSGHEGGALRSEVLSLARAANASSRLEMLQSLSANDRGRLLSSGIRTRESRLLTLLKAAWLAPEPNPPSLQAAPGDASETVRWLAEQALSRTPLAELARRAGRSLRSIQRACRKLGTTPQDVLRDARLDRARTMLQAPAASVSVADVAQSVGYPHLGRFAAYYRERFREMPSETLARSRPARPVTAPLSQAQPTADSSTAQPPQDVQPRD